ncbi:MAG: alcohol dehydrogenase catalytic domain-containing protein, partial [Lacunisphaera sp.]|nr:alcohol dehydrogenase catalytic domain-containing protein [Lacunisphaera sp.]
MRFDLAILRRERHRLCTPMRALRYPAFDRLEIGEAPLGELRPDEVRLRVAACGICGSELESFKHRSPRRPPPLVMG